jgi:DNA recombination protein RmuC
MTPIFIASFVLAVIVGIIATRFISPQNGRLQTQIQQLARDIDRVERAFREESSRGREEMGTALKGVSDSLMTRLSENITIQKSQFDGFSQQITNLTQGNEQRLERMRETIEGRLKSLQDDNSQKLEKMRQTVDEKLHDTLEKRLGESFKLVSDRLEQVHKGLGEMQTLASGVGDLKKVLTNIKTRGTWGEIQLGALLEQILTTEQYATNVATRKGSSERVEFAIKLPGKDHDGVVWLPIDSKFPVEDYQRLMDAQDLADQVGVDEAMKQLANRVSLEAKTIRDKYIEPPYTTDFGIMFLPSEGLYAEVLRRPGLSEKLQSDYRVVVTGPTTLAALLNSLQMGFRTLAIEKRSSEVWQILGAVKAEFTKFGDILEKTEKKLQEASNTISLASQKSRTIERQLKGVQSLPSSEIPVMEIPIHALEELSEV